MSDVVVTMLQQPDGRRYFTIGKTEVINPDGSRVTFTKAEVYQQMYGGRVATGCEIDRIADALNGSATLKDITPRATTR